MVILWVENKSNTESWNIISMASEKTTTMRTIPKALELFWVVLNHYHRAVEQFQSTIWTMSIPTWTWIIYQIKYCDLKHQQTAPNGGHCRTNNPYAIAAKSRFDFCQTATQENIFSISVIDCLPIVFCTSSIVKSVRICNEVHQKQWVWAWSLKTHNLSGSSKPTMVMPNSQYHSVVQNKNSQYLRVFPLGSATTVLI